MTYFKIVIGLYKDNERKYEGSKRLSTPMKDFSSSRNFQKRKIINLWENWHFDCQLTFFLVTPNQIPVNFCMNLFFTFSFHLNNLSHRKSAFLLKYCLFVRNSIRSFRCKKLYFDLFYERNILFFRLYLFFSLIFWYYICL